MTGQGSGSVGPYVLRRGIYSLAVLLAIVVFNFLLVHSAPGDPTLLLGGDNGTPEYYDGVRAQYGLDRPLYEQLFRYLAEIARGQFGFSFLFHRPVIHVILSRLPATLLLTGTAIFLSATLGILLGVVAAFRRGTWVDTLITAGVVVFYSLPVFWLAQLLLLVFALKLNWFPAQGMFSFRPVSGGLSRFSDLLNHLILPAASLTASYLALVARLTRTKMIEALRSEYVITARAKGVPFDAVVFQHALRNALLPVVTVIGYNFGLMFAGSVLTEIVFAWPGLGRLIFDAVYARDYPVLMGGFILIAVTVILCNLLTDLVYGVVDPRIRYD